MCLNMGKARGREVLMDQQFIDRQIRINCNLISSLKVVFLLHPPCIPSPFPCSVSVAQGQIVTEHKLIPLGFQRFNDWCVQTSISNRNDMYPPPQPPPSHSLSPADTEYVLPVPSATVCLSLTLGGSECPLHEVGYTSCCPGNPGPAHYPAPLRHSSL